MKFPHSGQVIKEINDSLLEDIDNILGEDVQNISYDEGISKKRTLQQSNVPIVEEPDKKKKRKVNKKNNIDFIWWSVQQTKYN